VRVLAGANGTKKVVERYGRLVCVLCRFDRERRVKRAGGRVVEEEAPWLLPDALYLVKIDGEDRNPSIPPAQHGTASAGPANEPGTSARAEPSPRHGIVAERSTYLQVDVDI